MYTVSAPYILSGASTYQLEFDNVVTPVPQVDASNTVDFLALAAGTYHINYNIGITSQEKKQKIAYIRYSQDITKYTSLSSNDKPVISADIVSLVGSKSIYLEAGEYVWIAMDIDIADPISISAGSFVEILYY